MRFVPGFISKISLGLFLCIIGGLLVSTLLTLLVVPCFYSLVDAGIQRVRNWFGSRKKIPISDSSKEIMGK